MEVFKIMTKEIQQKEVIVRSKVIQCRVSDDEYKEIEAKATKMGLSVGSYLRMLCLVAKVDVSLGPKTEKNK